MNVRATEMVLGFSILAVSALGASGAAQTVPSSTFSALHFRNIGPLSGRIDTVSGVPGDPTIYYAGGLGGLFKSVDGGVTWASVFNRKPVSSIGAIGVAASDPSVVYVGTGESNLRNDVAFGDGVWRTSDSGKTWKHVGLAQTGHIAAIAVDTHNPDRAFVAALGNVYKPSEQRGIYRTLDGGKTWQRVLFTDDRTGASSIAIDPADPNVLLAGMWEGWRNPYHLTSGGPSDGVYESTDGGDHWTRLQGHGLPASVTGRIAIAFAPSNPNRVYALIESSQGTLWRSDDRGASWRMVNGSHGINQRPFYFTSLSVDPKNEQQLYFMSVQMWRSTDGGGKATKLKRTRGGDYHQLWIAPDNPSRMIAADDEGAEVSYDAGKTWLNASMAVAQSYHVDTDDRVPYTVCSEDQDAGSACGPSNSLTSGGISPDSFFGAGGGESGWIVIDQRNPNLIYGDGYQGSVTQYDRSTMQSRAIDVWPEDAMGWPAAPLKYRFQWTSPLAMSPQHPHRLYMGGNRIFQTDNGGVTWRAISPDLTRDDRARQGISGTPITPDNTSVEYYDVVFSIAASPVRDGTIWAGTDDGRVWLTHDDGATWSNVTPAALKGAPGARWLRVDYVAPSPFDANTAYMVADGHKWGDRAPHVFVTRDDGSTWSDIAADLPQDSYARMIRPDPFRRGLLYAGTETGLYYSLDDGVHWTAFANHLPTVPVYDFTVQKRFDDLVVGTHGRGIWILDDLHALQETDTNVLGEPLHLFTLRTAYRYHTHGAYSVSQFTGANPPYGADINMYLKSAPNKGVPILVRILDGTHVIRTIAVKKPHPGVNRVWWNLRYEDIKPVKGFVPWARGGFDGPRALPGTYSVRVTDGAHTVSGALQVAMDPRSKVSMQALREQLAFLLRVRSDLTTMTASIDRLHRIEAKGGPKAAMAGVLLHRLYNPEVTQAEDALRYPEQVYGQLSFLASSVASADAAPTPAEVTVLRALETQAKLLVAKANSLARPVSPKL
ncbi:MAG: WD40/YVTN/BNR-like repeat-containing protein [Vulcanimicrobiaceae bacterium]